MNSRIVSFYSLLNCFLFSSLSAQTEPRNSPNRAVKQPQSHSKTEEGFHLKFNNSFVLGGLSLFSDHPSATRTGYKGSPGIIEAGDVADAYYQKQRAFFEDSQTLQGYKIPRQTPLLQDNKIANLSVVKVGFDARQTFAPGSFVGFVNQWKIKIKDQEPTVSLDEAYLYWNPSRSSGLEFRLGNTLGPECLLNFPLSNAQASDTGGIDMGGLYNDHATGFPEVASGLYGSSKAIKMTGIWKLPLSGLMNMKLGLGYTPTTRSNGHVWKQESSKEGAPWTEHLSSPAAQISFDLGDYSFGLGLGANFGTGCVGSEQRALEGWNHEVFDIRGFCVSSQIKYQKITWVAQYNQSFHSGFSKTPLSFLIRNPRQTDSSAYKTLVVEKKGGLEEALQPNVFEAYGAYDPQKTGQHSLGTSIKYDFDNKIAISAGYLANFYQSGLTFVDEKGHKHCIDPSAHLLLLGVKIPLKIKIFLSAQLGPVFYNGLDKAGMIGLYKSHLHNKKESGFVSPLFSSSSDKSVGMVASIEISGKF